MKNVEVSLVVRSITAKSSSNHAVYIRVLRGMSPEDRLRKAFELSDFTRSLFVHGLKKLHSDLSEHEFHRLVLRRMEICHNRNY